MTTIIVERSSAKQGQAQLQDQTAPQSKCTRTVPSSCCICGRSCAYSGGGERSQNCEEWPKGCGYPAVSKRAEHLPTSVQKGGILGMPGCLEHTGAVTQLIKEARENQGNLSVLWLDLANAYGPIPLKLVQLTLTKYHVPSRIRDLIADYHSNFRMRVFSGAITSRWHKVEIGIITGCPYLCVTVLPSNEHAHKVC